MRLTEKRQIDWSFINLDEVIYPIFIKEGITEDEPIETMPGISRLSLNNLSSEIDVLLQLGIKRILLFGIPSSKDSEGKSAGEDNIVSYAVKTIRKISRDIDILTDICICAYTDHGHCALLQDDGRQADREKTLYTLSQMALSHVEAGANWVCPSAMMEGQVGAIRQTLDANGYENVRILGYSAKFCSFFYSPFREAMGSSPVFGDRSCYQLDYNHPARALSAVKNDILECADSVMVKPSLCYLDIIQRIQSQTNVPLTAYNVSGEYSMVKQGVLSGAWDEQDIVHELLSAIKRAGADWIITYHAKDLARWRADNNG